MIAWLKALFKPKEIEVIDSIDLSHVSTPLNQPNDVVYKLPNPIQFKPTKVKFHIKNKRRTTTKK